MNYTYDRLITPLNFGSTFCLIKFCRWGELIKLFEGDSGSTYCFFKKIVSNQAFEEMSGSHCSNFYNDIYCSFQKKCYQNILPNLLLLELVHPVVVLALGHCDFNDIHDKFTLK